MGEDLAVQPGVERPFSLTRGGPFHELLRRLHLLHSSGQVRVAWLVVLAWGPLGIGATLRLAFGVPVEPIFLDISVHVRFFIGMPLLFVAADLLEPQVRGAVAQLYVGRFADRAALDRVVGRAEHLRDSAWGEAALLAVAVVLGQLALLRVVGPTGLVSGTVEATWSFSRIWYALFSLPLLQFLMLRWLWRWCVWIYILVRVSRLPLAATATHPDRAAGLGFLAWPLGGFTWFVFAVSCVLAGAWATQLLAGRATVPALLPTALAFFVIAVAVGCAPLLLFCGHLHRVRRRDLATYTEFNLDYVRAFHAKWIEGRSPPETLLGTPDIQSLNDTQTAFQVILETRLLVFSLPRLRFMVFAIVAPMVPLVATVVPLDDLVQRLGHAVLGVPPG